MTAVTLLLAYVAAALSFGYGVYCVLQYGHRQKNLPPGPPTLPIIGNLHQIPTTGAHYRFTEWANRYGGIFSLKLGRGTMLVLTDRALVKELVDKRGPLYSHRPASYVTGLITRSGHVLTMPYDDAWRSFRKLIHQHFMAAVCDRRHVRVQNAEAVQMLRDFMLRPDLHMVHPKRFSNSIINSIVFGIRSKDPDAPQMKAIYSIMSKWSAVMETGATPPVDFFPWLRHIPERFLGNWVSRATAVGREMDALYDAMLRKIEQRRAAGVRRDSFMDAVLDQQEKHRFSRSQLGFLGGVLQEGGSDTTASVILAAIQAMVKNPHVQRKAQDEIDAVVGEDRSPVWEDFGKLPYVNMIMKEAQRWRPILPLMFPHALSKDDWTADGKFLPAGSTVIVNVWGLHMDPTTHPSPDSFIPERYASRPLLAPEYAAGDWETRDHYGYGAGRRICIGIHLAERNLFLALAKLLWAFTFEEEVDADGNPVLNDSRDETGYSDGFVHCAKNYGCRTTLRSEKRGETVLREFEEATREVFSEFSEG